MSYQPPGGPTPPPDPPGYAQPSYPPPPYPPPHQQHGAPYPAAGYASQGYGFAPATSRWLSLKGLSTALMVLLAISGVLTVFAAVTLFHRASLVDDFTSFRSTSIKDLQDADDAVGGTVGFFVFLTIAIGIVWVIWQFRHSKNATMLRGTSPGLGPPWAIAGWIIPVGNLALPQLELLQSAKASDPDLAQGQPVSSGRVPSTLIGWWVALDFASALFWLGRFTRPSNDELIGRDDLDRFVRADQFVGVACIVMTVAAVLAIVLVRTLTERQMRAMAANPAPAAPVGPASPPWQQPQQWQPAPSWQAPPPSPPPPPQQPPPQQWPPPSPPPTQ